MKMRLNSIATFAALTLAVSATTDAAPILEWQMNGIDGSASSITATGNGITGTVTLGSGLTLGTTKADAWGATGFNNTNAANAFAEGDYFVFTITADPGVTFSPDQLQFALNRFNTSGAVAGQWQYSFDGASFTNFGTFTAISAGTVTAGKSLSTTAPIFDNIAEVTFRLALYGNAGTTLPGDAIFYLVNTNSGANPMSLQGTAVPEPSTAALLAIGLAGGLLARRRRKA